MRILRKLKNNKAQALIMVYMVVAAFLVMSAALLHRAIVEKNIALRNTLENEVFYLAEGAIENAISSLMTGMANFQINNDVASYTVTSTFSTFQNVAVTTVITRLEDTDRVVPEGGVNYLVRNYEAVATATHPQYNDISVKLHQIFARRVIPTFQFSVFYNQDLELQPGPSMALAGRIHSNNDIYIDCYDNGATFTINSEYLLSAGSIFHGRKIDRRHSEGIVRIKKAGTGSYVKMNPNAPSLNTPPYYDSESWPEADGSWTVDGLSRWSGTVRDSTHGVTSLVAPSVNSLDPDGYYAQNAGLYIYNNAIYTGRPPALGGTGTLLTEGTGVNNLPVGTITSTAAFKNNREGKFISMTDIDMQKLAGFTSDADKADGVPSRTSRLPANGLLYVTRDEAVGAGLQPGIRLKKGSEISRSAGLTVVSDDPVYVQGNFNTVSKKPAAIICDSLNILSSAWSNDANSTGSVDTARTATATTVNAAFIAGTEATDAGVSDGGGFQNYPRLHEKWTGISLSITGSFVSLGASQVATGHYQWGPPQYYPPQRTFSWDSSFDNIANLPPYTSYVVGARKVAWWKE